MKTATNAQAAQAAVQLNLFTPTGPDWETIRRQELIYYTDPGHGWLRVPIYRLQQLGILDKISKYSYKKDIFAYLEEDMDMSTYIRAEQVHKTEQDLNRFWSLVQDEYTDRSSKIRNYRKFTA